MKIGVHVNRRLRVLTAAEKKADENTFFFLQHAPLQIVKLHAWNDHHRQCVYFCFGCLNTLRTGDADLRLYITKVQDG
jgi:hypothetical protein